MDLLIRIALSFVLAVCGAVINLASYKEHAIECKAKLAKSHSGKSGSGKSKSGRYILYLNRTFLVPFWLTRYLLVVVGGGGEG